jgi:hypothetical protein
VSELTTYRAELAAIAPDEPPAPAWLDYELLRLAIERELFEWETLRDWARNPMGYVFACDVSNYLKRNYAPLPTRVKAITAHLGRVPDVLAQARANLELPMPRTFAQVSLEMTRGTVTFLREELPAQLTAVAESELMSRFSGAQVRAIAALESFTAWLQDEVLPRPMTSLPSAWMLIVGCRVGEGVELPLDQLLAMAESDLAHKKPSSRRLVTASRPTNRRHKSCRTWAAGILPRPNSSAKRKR